MESSNSLPINSTCPECGLNPFDLTNGLLKCLNDREQDILKRRHALEKQRKETLEAIGAQYQITRERVRQIERASLAKIKRLINYQQELSALIAEIDCLLAKYGGVIAHQHLIEELSSIKDQAHVDYSRERRNINFLLENFVSGIINNHPSGETHLGGWSKSEPQLITALGQIKKLETYLSDIKKPLSADEIARQLGLAADPAYACLHLSRNVSENAFGLWGLNSWPTINPKRMADRIYLVLVKYNEPLHYRDIAKNISLHYQKDIHPPTVHNELIADDRFVLVGRGIYALREWGYTSGTVREVVEKILAGSETPLTRASIIEAVCRQRQVARSTILLALNNHAGIERINRDQYRLIIK